MEECFGRGPSRMDDAVLGYQKAFLLLQPLANEGRRLTKSEANDAWKRATN